MLASKFHNQYTSLLSQALPVNCHSDNKIKYGKNWRNEERNKELLNEKESLPH